MESAPHGGPGICIFKGLPPVLLPHMIMDLSREWPFVLARMGMPICAIDS